MDSHPSYHGYLCLDDLLSLQRPLAEPTAHDELMFIVVHQVYELWFRVLLHELTAVRDAMLGRDVHRALLLLERCSAIERQVLSAFEVLDTLSPRGFLEFRDALSTASGFQSVQYREIELLSTSGDRRRLVLPRQSSAEARRTLVRRLREPTIWDAFVAVLAAHGFAVGHPAARGAALLSIARGDRHPELWRLAEGLIDHDQAWSLWRSRHLLLAERQIGVKTGTGGSTGVGYLRSRQHGHLFPELWEVRSQL
jgi:tryptophan 2,3-dioxygenase